VHDNINKLTVSSELLVYHNGLGLSVDALSFQGSALHVVEGRDVHAVAGFEGCVDEGDCLGEGVEALVGLEEVDRSTFGMHAVHRSHVDVLAEDRRHKAELFLALVHTDKVLSNEAARHPPEVLPLGEDHLPLSEILSNDREPDVALHPRGPEGILVPLGVELQVLLADVVQVLVLREGLLRNQELLVVLIGDVLHVAVPLREHFVLGWLLHPRVKDVV